MTIQAGVYDADDTSWFDLRLTDKGWIISLCDSDMNVRYTVVVDKGEVTNREVTELLQE